MSTYIAANGQTITEEMIDNWCASYEKGEFPQGEHTVGNVMQGRPPLSTDKTTTLTIKIPIGMKAALIKKAKERGQTASGYTREIIAEDLIATG